MNQRGGSSADVLVKIVLIFFISLLSFSVGTYVGNQVSKSDFRKAALEEEYSQTLTDDQQGQDIISDDDIKSLTEEFVKIEKDKIPDQGQSDIAEAKKNDKINKKLAEYKKSMSAAPKPDLVPTKNKDVSSTARKVASGIPPTTPDKDKRKPSSYMLPKLANSPVGKYTVQVASFATEGEAKNRAQMLKSKGLSAFYIPAKVKGRTWFRVSVGLFSDLKSAKAFRKELKNNDAVGATIIQRIDRM